MVVNICNVGFFGEVLPGVYHVFPEKSILRDYWCMSNIVTRYQGKRLLKFQNLKQPDGVYLRCISVYDKYNLSRIDILEACSVLLNNTITLFNIENWEYDRFITFLRGAKLEGSIYVWHINNFIDAKRYYAAYVSNNKTVIINLCPFIKGRKPADGLGFTITQDDSIETAFRELSLGSLPIHNIEYMSAVRLCGECGNIYNVNLAARLHRSQGWIADKRQKGRPVGIHTKRTSTPHKTKKLPSN